ncbi:MAG: hypothetical protein JO057_17105 [Chloroflexi bacterium]|nr:hypothetical protein [Chloroflexota bacterium]
MARIQTLDAAVRRGFGRHGTCVVGIARALVCHDVVLCELDEPTAFLINISCGPIVDEAALVRALQSKRIAGAGLDVFDRRAGLA